MAIRTLILAASVSLAALAAPAIAQVDDRYDGIEVETGAWDGPFVDIGGATIHGDFDGSWIGDDRFVSDEGRMLYIGEDGIWREDALGEGEHLVERRVIRRTMPHRMPHRTGHHAAHHPQRSGPVLGYTREQRDAWIAQCIALHDRDAYALHEDRYYADYDRDDDADGGLIGGLLGAVIGGVAGNRIDNDGSRLAGTLIGAGLGGVAGAVIGAAIDRDDDRWGDRHDDDYYHGGGYRDTRYDNAAYYANYCEAYLSNYENGYGVPGTVIPVVAITAPVHHQRPMRAARHIEVIEEEIAAPAHHAPAHEPAHEPRIRRSLAPRPVKTQPIK